jgi:hypothetical protein
MQATTKDARSRFIIFSLSAFSLQNIWRAISACRFCAASCTRGLRGKLPWLSEKRKVEKTMQLKRGNKLGSNFDSYFFGLQPHSGLISRADQPYRSCKMSQIKPISSPIIKIRNWGSPIHFQLFILASPSAPAGHGFHPPSSAER